MDRPDGMKCKVYVVDANAWHSDNQKARAYQQASDDQKKQYEKCAEIRGPERIGLRRAGSRLAVCAPAR